MKLFKSILLISTLAVLMGCNSNNKSVSSSASISSSEESSIVSTASVSSISSSSISSVSSSTQDSSISSNSYSTSSVSSSLVVDGEVLTINLYQPSCGSIGKEVLADRLKAYINEVADTTFVDSIQSENCQITNDIPNKGDKVLQLGSSSTIGELSFTFKRTIKMVTITAQTYHKPYTNYQTGELVPNVDSYSALRIGTTTGEFPIATLELAKENGEAVEKTFSLATNSNKLKLSTVNEENGRAFVKAITLVY